VAEQAADPALRRRRHKRSWLRRHRHRIYLVMMVIGASLVAGGAAVLVSARPS
jgi:hypothetical protein